MKAFAVAAVVALVALNLLLLFRQQRLEQHVATLQSSNAELAQELAGVSMRFSPEAARHAETRLARAEQFMDAVENRLTNATVVLQNLQAVAQRTTTTDPGGRTPSRNSGSGLDTVISSPHVTASDIVFQPLQVSSSHNTDGQLQRRSWGPEQVVGPPDTHSAGDLPTAWAPYSSQGKGEEWLHVNYERAVEVAEVRVRETHNPGAISKIAASLPDGREVVLWEGTEPPAQAPVDMAFSVPLGVNANSIKVFLDRTRVSGWNEIDAVELVGRDGSRQWATSAKASSSYAEPVRTSVSSSR